MAAKTYDQLVEEIVKLQKELENEKTRPTAEKLIEEWAKNNGYKFKVTKKTTLADYKKVLDEVLDFAMAKLYEEIDGLKARLADEILASEQLLEAKEKAEEDAYVFSDEIAKLRKQMTNTLLEIENKTKYIEELTARVTKEAGYKKRAFEAALKYKHESEANKKQVVELLKKLEELEKLLAEKEKSFLARMEEEDKRRGHIIAEAGRHKREKLAVESELSDVKKAKRITEGENVQLREDIEILRTVKTRQLYADVVSMIIDTFNTHIADEKKKIPPYQLQAKNSQIKNRQVKLWEAILKAEQLDKKAEKEAKKKGGTVFYPDSGFKKIFEEILGKYKEMVADAPSAVIEFFKQTYSSEQDRQDGEVSDEEILKTILETEPQKPFFKTAKGITLAIVGGVLLTVMIGSIIVLVVKNTQTQDELNSIKGELDNDTNNGDNNGNTDVTPQPEKLPENVVLNVDDAEVESQFESLQEQLASARGGALVDLEYCQYNRTTGEVVLQFEVVSPRGTTGIETVTFEMDMGNMSNEVVEGGVALSFAAIGQQLLDAQERGEVSRIANFDPPVLTDTPADEAGSDASSDNNTMNNTGSSTGNSTVEPVAPVGPSTNVDYSLIQNENGSFDIICRVVVSEVVDGHTQIQTYTSDVYSFKAGTDLERAQNLATQDFYEQLGFDGIEME